MGMVDPAVFEHIQERIDEESSFQDELRDVIQVLNKQIRSAQAILSRAHSTPSEKLPEVIEAAQKAIGDVVETISKLSKHASSQPYYKWNHMWTRSVQDACFTILLCAWLKQSSSGSEKLLTIEEVGDVLKAPVNLKDRDAFHLTIEEYLLALVTLLDELARLARNSVTLGDFRRPLVISQFIKDVHAGFQILNLKNDILRRRSDGIKYRVKEVEDVVYDLSLRKLIPPPESGEEMNTE